MNLKQAQKQETHERILQAAASLFRTDGYQQAGVGQIMESIGLTVGGFYNHFDSKDALFEEVIETTTSPVVEGEDVDESDPLAYLHTFINRYLSTEHRDNPAGGCMLPCLTPEVARSDDEVRRAYTQFVTRIGERVSKNITAAEIPDARKRACSLMAVLVGGLMVSRAVDDEELSQQILAASRETAEAIVAAP